ncbi:Inositol-1-monophosphatase [Hartmannibacter diazotrophicus]|uniref:Inositol-1-monophosphatase n=1 Tax=Hartmannibacter diazotrophicus TaxID=1482074 RepID=A0A2C9DCI3_9HYPH|nr:inositol monophosphatase [Hartmannibacter diazotrophicus]SON57838.1 Inositol-1-monophosphatase [Hartmannibacter diazotrophicus]
MLPDDIAARFAFACELGREAGALAHQYFEKLETLTIRSKGVQDLASEADVETEILIRRKISEAFPDDGFLGEETGMTENETGGGIWVVDPIDGTQPFVSDLSSWCVSIAYVLDGEIEIGVIYAPVRDEFFAVRRGEPATLNGRPIAVSTSAGLDQGLVSVGYSTRIGPDTLLSVMAKLLKQGGMFHREGSGALSLCYVACGRLIGYVETHINAWDCLAAIAIIHGAGGRTNDFLAGDGLRKGNRVIAGSPTLYPALEALLDV